MAKRNPYQPDLFGSLEPEDVEYVAMPQNPEESGDIKGPLPARMRPRSFDEYVGQEHLVGPGRVLRRLVDSDRLPSMILWGPPGTGKTSLASLLAHLTRGNFVALSAVTVGVAEVRKVVAEAKERWRLLRRHTILFLDEIHRFSKSQQDVVLPHVEDGTITLVGATTENPSFQVIAPLLSRCRVFVLKALKPAQLVTLLQRSLSDSERGLGGQGLEMADDTCLALAEACAGDARMALNALEEVANSVKADDEGKRVITKERLAEALGRPSLRHDRAGESHYDIASALIKSIRGTDPDGALYWLARLLEGGEDPLFIARRLVILASEDVGLADPHALPLAMAAQQAVHFVGMPEGYYPLAEAALYLALAPKSNSVGMSYQRAVEAVHRDPGAPVPMHLRNAPTKLMESLGYAKGYKYAHDYPHHYVRQDFLPENVQGTQFYNPGRIGYEARIAARWEALARGEDPTSQPATSATGTPQNTASANATSQGTTPQSNTPQSTTPQPAPQTSTSQSTTPQNTTP